MVEAGLRNERVSQAGPEFPREQLGSRCAGSFPVAGLQLQQRYFPDQAGEPTVKPRCTQDLGQYHGRQDDLILLESQVDRIEIGPRIASQEGHQ